MNDYITGYLAGYMTKQAAMPTPPDSVTRQKLPTEKELPSAAEEAERLRRLAAERWFNKYIFESDAREALHSMALSALGGTTGIFDPRVQYNVHRDDPENAPPPPTHWDNNTPFTAPKSSDFPEDDDLYGDGLSSIGKSKGMGKQAADPKTQARMSIDDYPNILKAYHEWIARTMREHRQKGLSGQELGKKADTLRKQLQSWKMRIWAFWNRRLLSRRRLKGKLLQRNLMMMQLRNWI